MPTFNLKELESALNRAKTPEDVDDAFDKVFALSRTERKAVGDALEEAFLSSVIQPVESAVYLYGGMTHLRLRNDEAGKPLKKNKEITTEAQKIVQVALYIKELQGSDISPLMKTFADAAKKLSDEDYNSKECLFKPLDAVISTVRVRGPFENAWGL